MILNIEQIYTNPFKIGKFNFKFVRFTQKKILFKIEFVRFTQKKILFKIEFVRFTQKKNTLKKKIL
jgi:hypothetical protein